jgi:hypothetical protein
MSDSSSTSPRSPRSPQLPKGQEATAQGSREFAEQPVNTVAAALQLIRQPQDYRKQREPPNDTSSVQLQIPGDQNPIAPESSGTERQPANITPCSSQFRGGPRAAAQGSKELTVQLNSKNQVPPQLHQYQVGILSESGESENEPIAILPAPLQLPKLKEQRQRKVGKQRNQLEIFFQALHSFLGAKEPRRRKT